MLINFQGGVAMPRRRKPNRFKLDVALIVGMAAFVLAVLIGFSVLDRQQRGSVNGPTFDGPTPTVVQR
jgi:hypothetical protein